MVHRTLTFLSGTQATAATKNKESATQGAKYNSEFGLYCEMDKKLLHPEFRIEVNGLDILGRLNALESMQLGSEGREVHRINSMLSLVSATTL